jgi:hypothetical protein
MWFASGAYRPGLRFPHLVGESNRENEVVEQTLGYTENSQEAARPVGPASKPFGEQTLAGLVALPR